MARTKIHGQTDLIHGAFSVLLTWKPIWVFCPDAMYLPEFDTLMTEMSLSCP